MLESIIFYVDRVVEKAITLGEATVGFGGWMTQNNLEIKNL